MENEIYNLLIEVKVDKVTARQKAVEKLYDILSNRLSDVQRLVDDEKLAWDDVFKAAHQSTKTNAQKLVQSGVEVPQSDKKISSFERLILRVCESPSNGN